MVRTEAGKPRRKTIAPPAITLVSVYRAGKRAPELLYQLLEEREPHVNISHRALPTWNQHLRFIASHPYKVWYLIKCGPDYVGAIYLTQMNEIGIGVLAQHRTRGFAQVAIQELMQKHPGERFLANINPQNGKSIGLFQKMGFRIIQHTYELRSR